MKATTILSHQAARGVLLAALAVSAASANASAVFQYLTTIGIGSTPNAAVFKNDDGETVLGTAAAYTGEEITYATASSLTSLYGYDVSLGRVFGTNEFGVATRSDASDLFDALTTAFGDPFDALALPVGAIWLAGGESVYDSIFFFHHETVYYENYSLFFSVLDTGSPDPTTPLPTPPTLPLAALGLAGLYTLRRRAPRKEHGGVDMSAASLAS